MSLNSQINSSVVHTLLDDVFFPESEYDMQPGFANANNPLIFKIKNSDKDQETIEQFQGVPYFERRDEEQNIPQASARVANPKVYKFIEFAQEVPVPRRFMADQQFPVVQEMVKEMGAAAKETMDREIFSIFNKGFTSTLTNDGQTWFSDSHVSMSGQTVDNKLVDPLTESSLEDAVRRLIEQPAQSGRAAGHRAAILVVPPKLFPEAQRLTKSELRPGTGNNDMNYISQIYPDLKVFQSVHLSAAYGGSDTAWFLGGLRHNFYRFIREGLTTDLVDYKYQSNNSYLYKAFFREDSGPLSYDAWVGSTGLGA